MTGYTLSVKGIQKNIHRYYQEFLEFYNTSWSLKKYRTEWTHFSRMLVIFPKNTKKNEVLWNQLIYNSSNVTFIVNDNNIRTLFKTEFFKTFRTFLNWLSYNTLYGFSDQTLQLSTVYRERLFCLKKRVPQFSECVSV